MFGPIQAVLLKHAPTAQPGPPLTPMELRKISLLSSISVTIPLDQDFNVRAISPTGCRLSPELMLPQSGELIVIKVKSLFPHCLLKCQT